MARTPVLIPDILALDWEVRETRRDGNVPGPVLKILSTDPQTGAQTRLLHLPPGWRDEQLDWHPTTEEGYRLAGRLWMGGELLGEAFYLYRPKGILHGPVLADPLVGMTSINRMDGEPRIFRYEGTELPHRHRQPITEDWRASPFAWHEKLDTGPLPWDPVAAGPWQGASCKWLNRNRETGGGVVRLDLPPGWRGRSGAPRGSVEEFVISGSLVADSLTFAQWGYACRPAGEPAPAYATDEGAGLICWWELDEIG